MFVLFVCLSLCLFVCLFTCLFVCSFVCLFVVRLKISLPVDFDPCLLSYSVKKKVSKFYDLVSVDCFQIVKKNIPIC